MTTTTDAARGGTEATAGACAPTVPPRKLAVRSSWCRGEQEQPADDQVRVTEEDEGMTAKKIERCKRAIDRHRVNLALRMALADKDRAEKANTALVNTIANLRAAGVNV